MTRLQSHDNPANSALKIAKVNIAYGVLLLYHNSMCLCVCDDFNVHDIVCSYHIGWQTLYLVFIVSGKIGLFSKKMRVTKKTPSHCHSAVFLLFAIGSKIKNAVQRARDNPTIRHVFDYVPKDVPCICSTIYFLQTSLTKKTWTPSDCHSANQRSAVFLLLVIGSRIKNGVQRTWDAPTIRQLIDLIICAMYFSLIKNH